MLQTRHALGFAGLLALTACGPATSITLPLVHPSPFSRWGRRLSVQPFENDRAGLGERIAAGVRATGTFDLTGEGAQLGLSGVVARDEHGPERQASRPYTCHRQVPEQRTRQVPRWVQDPPPPPVMGAYGVPIYQPTTGHMEFTTQTYTEMVDHPYSCTQLVRWIEGFVRVEVRILARTRPPQVVWQRAIDVSDRDEQTGLQGSDSGDRAPAPVSGPAVLDRLHGQVVSQVTSAMVPRRDTITFDLSLGSDPRFEQALNLVRADNLEGAERLVDAIAQQFATPHSDSERAKLASALFDRGALRGFAGRLDDSIADLTRALELRPEATAWGDLLRVMRGLAAEVDQSRFRGETPTSVPSSPEEELPARSTPRPTAPRRARPRPR
ncbi:MAG: hypothetical protein Q8S73_27175 [Deltaproteobacteria bacterium]|nr:hypothetical protein [Deltaproteobacteria bacterium]